MEKNKRDTLKKKYFASKKDIDAICDSTTLLKWEILSKANKLGKQLWGIQFTLKRLSVDMGLPYTTTKRCLSLDNATPESWQLLKDKKISAFKLAMVCLLKSKVFQNEIVAAVIEDNMSTYKIKAFNPKNIADVNKWRHQKAAEAGYSRQDSAARNMRSWISRGIIFMLMPIKSFGEKNKDDMIECLKVLQLKIENYIKKYGS
ncbi:hypothetical protein LCGC14_0441900 [marine sediment metagenome]|uniref:Uncharacterized protein n=1 Tax=marine sediment metagenome TaxID=412755 RepID=A0A0F9V751_9ZZZZ